MAVRLPALRAGRSLTPEKFLVLISPRGRSDARVTVRLEESGKLKTSKDLIENRTRNLPASSIVSQQPTALSYAPQGYEREVECD
jgi:hypothetical protein